MIVQGIALCPGFQYVQVLGDIPDHFPGGPLLDNGFKMPNGIQYGFKNRKPILDGWI